MNILQNVIFKIILRFNPCTILILESSLLIENHFGHILKNLKFVHSESRRQLKKNHKSDQNEDLTNSSCHKTKQSHTCIHIPFTNLGLICYANHFK